MFDEAHAWLAGKPDDPACQIDVGGQQGCAIGPEDTPTPMLRVMNIEKTFGKRKVLDGVSLDVAPGEIVGLLGPNGAGKTVCFYGIMGLLRLDGGRILLAGEDVSALAMSERGKRGMGYLPQESSIFRGMSVEENIRAVLELRCRDRATLEKRLDALLGEFNIAYVRHTPSGALSGGERRRCEIARAMAADPKVILLDEPFAGVDPLSILDIKAMVRALKRRNVGVLITDHNVHEMLELVDRAYVIHAGRLLFEGEPRAILHDPDVRRLYLGKDFDE